MAGGARVRQPGAHEAAGLGDRRRRETDGLPEGAEARLGPQRQVGQRHHQGRPWEPRQGLEQGGPQPLGGRHARDVRLVQTQGREPQALLAAEALADVEHERLTPLEGPCGLQDRPRDVGLGVRLDGEGTGGADLHETCLQNGGRDGHRGAQAGQRRGEVGASELQPNESVRGGRRVVQRLLDVVRQERLAATGSPHHHQLRELAGAQGLDEVAVRPALLAPQQLQDLLVVAAPGREQRHEFGSSQRRMAEALPQVVQDAEEHARVGQLPLGAVEDGAHDVGVRAARLHVVAQPVDAAQRAAFVAARADLLAHALEHRSPRAARALRGWARRRHGEHCTSR